MGNEKVENDYSLFLQQKYEGNHTQYYNETYGQKRNFLIEKLFNSLVRRNILTLGEKNREGQIQRYSMISKDILSASKSQGVQIKLG